MQPLQEAMTHLLSVEPFYALFLLQFSRKYVDKLPYDSIAAVRFNTKTLDVTLCLTEKYDKLPLKHRMGVLKHEAEHIMRLHAQRMPHHNLIANIAQDIAINQDIQRDWLPDEACHLDKFEQIYPDMKLGMSAEQYYAIMIKDAEEKFKQAPGGSDQGRMDSHDFSDSSEEGGQGVGANEIAEALKNIVRGKAEAAYQQCKGAGTIPDNLQKTLDLLLKPQLSWRTLMKQFITKASDPSRVNTRYRPNRRYDMLYPGNRTKYTPRGIILVDTSGSTWSLQDDFFTEIKAAYQAGARFSIIECDTEVKKVYEYDTKTKVQPSGGGGTLYTPAFVEAVKYKPDFIIFFGDGDSADQVEMKVGCPVLWVLTPGAVPPAKFGKVVYIEGKV